MSRLFCLSVVLLGGALGCSERAAFHGSERLRALTLGQQDGDGLFWGFFDEELQAPCHFVEAGGGHVCSPADSAQIVFLEPSCAGLGVLLPPGSADAKVVTSSGASVKSGCNTWTTSLRWFEVGEVVEAPQQVFSESCYPLWVSPELLLHAAVEVGPERLAGATLEEAQPVGALSVRSLVTEDGARAPWDLYDVTRGLPCVPTDVSGGAVCAPLDQAQASGSVFADASCAEPVVESWDGCASAIVRQQTQSCDGAGSFHEIGAEVVGYYGNDAGGLCGLITTSTPAFRYEPTPAVLPGLSRASDGDGLAVELWQTEGITVGSTGRFVDPDRGPCLPEKHTDGTVACVPVGAGSASYTSGLFLDPGCLVPVATTLPCSEGGQPPSALALRAESPYGTRLVSVHEPAADVAGKFLYTGGPNSCFGFGTASPGVWSLGAELLVPTLELR